MTKTKIFVDCHVFDDGFQGTRTYIKELYLELIKDNDKHFFLASSDIQNLSKVFGLQDNITYLKYNSYNKFYRLLFDIPRLIKINKIDFAHFQYIVPPVKSCKYIVTTHDVLFIDFPKYFPTLNRIKNQFLYKWSARFSDIVLTVSDYSKKRIQKHFAIEDVAITTNAVSKVFFESYDKEAVQNFIQAKYNISKYIIYVSRWEPRKNHELVLKAFVHLELYKEFELVFMGEITFENDAYNAYFEKTDPSIKKKVHNFKRVEFDEMLQFIRAAELSVYPSIAEGFGIPPLESLAAGIPTITSNTTAMSDFDFLEPYSFDPLNQRDFEEKIQKVLQIDQEEIRKLQTALKNKYSWANAAKAFNQAIAKN